MVGRLEHEKRRLLLRYRVPVPMNGKVDEPGTAWTANRTVHDVVDIAWLTFEPEQSQLFLRNAEPRLAHDGDSKFGLARTK